MFELRLIDETYFGRLPFALPSNDNDNWSWLREELGKPCRVVFGGAPAGGRFDVEVFFLSFLLTLNKPLKAFWRRDEQSSSVDTAMLRGGVVPPLEFI